MKGGGHSRLLVEAALVDARIRDHGNRLETVHDRLTHQAAEATSPLERAKIQQHAYRVHEAAGALRYSAVTGTDDSDL